MDPAVLAARVLLAGVFATAAVTKLSDRGAALRAVEDFGLGSRAASAVARTLPLVELLVAVAMLVNPLARVAAAAAVVLLAGFSAGIANALRKGRAPDCGCFGGISAKPVSRWTLVRNGVLGALAVLVVASGASMSAWLAIGAGAAAAAAAFLATRIERPEAASFTTGGATLPRGLPLGAPAPEFELPATSGELRSLASLRARGRPALLLFLDSGCGSCAELHPHLRRWQRALRDQLSIAVVMRGDPAAAATLAAQHGVEDVLRDEADGATASRFQIAGNPSAIVVGADGDIASVPVVGADAIEELVRQTLQRAEDRQQWTPATPTG